MNKKPVFSIIAILLCLASESQERLINCNVEKNPDNTYSIFAESRIFSTYTIRVSFSGLNGYDVSPYVSGGNIGLVSVEPGKREIYELKTNGSGVTGSFTYCYQYYPGKYLSKAPDSSFAYLLPAAAGKSVRISKTSSLSERIGQKKRR